MARKPRFPPEPATRPDTRRPKGPTTHRSGPAPKDAREKAEAPTLPPPTKDPGPPPTTEPGQARSRSKRRDADRTSGMRDAKPRMPAATVDEVTADMSKDPRRERDDEGGDDEKT
jgi:hypothetical protein